MRIYLYKLFKPEGFLVVLFAFYGLAFLDNPLNWWASANIDGRYFYVYAAFALCFLVGVYGVRFAQQGQASDWAVAARQVGCEEGEGQSGLTRQEIQVLLSVYSLSIFLTLANNFKRGGFAIFSTDRNLFRALTATFGGYVVYPADLITPLMTLAIYQYHKSKKLMWLWFALASILLQVLQLNRQEVLVAVLTAAITLNYFRRVRPSSVVIGGIAGALALTIVLGVLAIFRVGSSAQFSTNIPVYELPIWVTLGDMSGAVRFAHYIADLVGPGGLNGQYTWGMFISVFIPHFNNHGAAYIMNTFTSDLTAQSIGAPISYFADNGMWMVCALGAVQGAMAEYFYGKAKQTQSLFYCMAYVSNYLDLLFAIRAGTVNFMPESLYRLAALAFILRQTLAKKDISSSIFRTAGILFAVSLLVSLAALALRV